MAREQLYHDAMAGFVSNYLRHRRTVLSGLTFAALLTSAEAKTHRKHHPFSVALQPFELVHSAVHAVALPVIRELPRVVAAAAVEPARIALHASRILPADVPRAEPIDVAETVDYAQPIRVAYVVPRAQPALPPRPEIFRADEPDEDSAPAPQAEWRSERPMVAGSVAVLRNGIAYAPAHAPQSVKNAIWAINTLRDKPYTWGGGHRSFYDSGYDCSGTVSFAMHNAGALSSPLPSSDFLRYGERGRGRWITIYARRGHVFAMIAGLRLDTTDFRNGDEGPRWHTDGRDLRGFEARHPASM